MHAGRLTTYALLGAIMGAMGATFWRQQWLPIQRGLFAFASVLLLTYGILLLVRSAGDAWRSVWLERLLGRVAGRLSRGAATLGGTLQRQPPLLRRYITGMAWGLVPCGMVYGALAVALLAGNAASGAVVMLAFGAGTLPNLLMMSGFAGVAARLVAPPVGAWRGRHRHCGVRDMGAGARDLAARDAQRTRILSGAVGV